LKKRILPALAAACLVAASGVTLADDRTVELVENYPGSYQLLGEHVDGGVAFSGDGKDVFTFDLPIGPYDLSVAVTGDFLTQLESVTLFSAGGATVVPVVNIGPFSFASLTAGVLSGPFSLEVVGPYSGGYTVYLEANALPVPEPGTGTMTLAGLAAVGLMSRRILRSTGQ
jgi:uncharacterized protein (TIGR03382 family)